MTDKTIGIMTGRIITEVGPQSLWDSFFRLLDGNFSNAGKDFPLVRKRLHSGKIKSRDAVPAGEEMKSIRKRFVELSAPGGGTLHESLLTTTGRNLIDELVDAFEFASQEGYDVKIVSYEIPVDTAFLK